MWCDALHIEVGQHAYALDHVRWALGSDGVPKSSYYIGQISISYRKSRTKDATLCESQSMGRVCYRRSIYVRRESETNLGGALITGRCY